MVVTNALRMALVWNVIQPAFAAVFRRDALLRIDFPTETEPLYDLWFSYQLALEGGTFRNEPRRLTNHRVHDNSLTRAGFGEAEDWIFRHAVDELGEAEPELVQEITNRWISLRWGRATAMMYHRERRADSQRLLRELAPVLPAVPSTVARLAVGPLPLWSVVAALKRRFGSTTGVRKGLLG